MDLYAGTEAPRSFKLSRKATKMLRLASGLALLSVMLFSSTEEGLGNYMRRLCHLEVTFNKGEDEGPIGVWTEVYTTDGVNYVDRALQPQDPIVQESQEDVAFVISLLECPDQPFYEHPGVREKPPPNEMFYDHFAMLKYSICGETDTVTIGGIERHATIYALIPGDAVECMGLNNEPFDRVRVLEELGYIVKIIGSPIKKVDITGSEYLRNSIEQDVGLKDLIKLQAFNMTTHPLAVLIEYDTFILKDLTTAFEDFLIANADASFPMDYSPFDVAAKQNNRGVNTGLFIFRPSTQVYNDLIQLYTTSAFDPVDGWGGTGIAGFPGALGTKGLLTYYYSNEDRNTIILDKCTYNNGYETRLDVFGNCRDGSTGGCEDCQITPFQDIVAARLTDECTLPYACNPSQWEEVHLCNLYHKTWFENRVDFETHWFSSRTEARRAKQEGTFIVSRYYGFCQGPGMDGYDKMILDAPEGPKSIPDPPPPPQASCPPCGEGEVVTVDSADNCGCSSDECSACPVGTHCQPSDASKGIPVLCLDCTCGFCDKKGESCCEINARGNNCKSATNKKECNLQNGFFPGFPGTGNACSGVEVSATATPNGCGCHPNRDTPCTYDRSDQDPKNMCFIMNSNDILEGTIDSYQGEDQAKAADCKNCILTECADQSDIGCVTSDSTISVDDMQACMGDLKAKGNRDQCLAKCSERCQWK
mmetsp:Transcript_231/g.341  ORF Transcript_231/g.341 Transcript_231/m.341 type:complete len:704 (-) Transcript_231:190-2301(-)